MLDNAIKYSPRGEIEVRLRAVTNEKDPFARIEVKDQGIGIKKEDLGRLFGKFQRTEEARKFDANGTGIGLYFVKRIIEDHGGRVGVESDGVGKGSTFFVELPMKR
jgi:signal transduction histidine kinase